MAFDFEVVSQVVRLSEGNTKEFTRGIEGRMSISKKEYGCRYMSVEGGKSDLGKFCITSLVILRELLGGTL